MMARGRFAELVLRFTEEVPFSSAENIGANSILVRLPKSNATALAPLNYYDPRLVDRILTRDLGPGGCEFELFLKSREIKGSVRAMTMPFRLVIDLFDKNYALDLDPQTGLPLANVGLEEDTAVLNQNHERSVSQQPAFQPLDFENKQEPAKTPDTPSLAPKHKLLQAEPAPNYKSTLLSLDEVAEGRASYWTKYPIYIYPIVIDSFRGRKNAVDNTQIKPQVQSEAQKDAEMALKLFSFGHEKRSLKLYQAVLSQDATIFDKDVLHLWALAELHFAHGDLILADGYFKAINNKFPESDLANFASLRRLDIKAIKIIANNQAKELTKLALELDSIKSQVAEISAQKDIRTAFWTKENLQDQESIGYIEDALSKDLLLLWPEIESKRTAFLALSLILKGKLAKKHPWSSESATLAGKFFSTYDSDSGKPYFVPLKKEVIARLADALTQASLQEDYISTIRIFDEIPKGLKSVAKDPEVAWALAQAYRQLGKTATALKHYEIAASKYPKGLKKFKATFWAAVINSTLAAKFTQPSEGLAKERAMAASKDFDNQLRLSWSLLSDEDKKSVFSLYKSEFEDTLTAPTLLKTPALIVLDAWTQSLSTELAVIDERQGENWQKSYSPSAQTVRLITKLAARFTELGLISERRQSVFLLKKIKPSLLEKDRDAQKAWSKMLVELAEDYRKDDQLLEAAELYTFAATNSINWEDRAESLYKGGLLLYKVGRRQEAVAAFTAASQDGNNLFYANLAKERLHQLSP